MGQLPSLQRTSARTKDIARQVPKPIVDVVRVNGQPVRALLDSGSLGNFLSSAVADQLKVNKFELAKALPVQLAVQGSRTKANYGRKVKFEYADIGEERYFNIININGYNMILGTPFMFQHKVAIGFNDI
jgi:hypothetical protein